MSVNLVSLVKTVGSTVLGVLLVAALCAQSWQAQSAGTADCQDLLAATNPFKNMTLDFDCAEVAKQSKEPGALRSFYQAFALAIESILNDGNHPESPLANATLIAMDHSGLSYSQNNVLAMKQLAQEIVLPLYLDRATTTVEVLPYGEIAEGDESPVAQWIFVFRIKDLSDHLTYVVVPRKELSQKIYNYGFN